uniref:Uncharacterized protein n=1 Tax=Rhizophora mucronata TaxID=61149 RepID=A0A2P2ND43_RHIMU
MTCSLICILSKMYM